MSFLETKGTLAKLLATENLTVQHDSTVRTASFNTATRVLTLPVLQCDDSHVYDMFVGHEVGHALWTPTDWLEQVPEDVPSDYINVIEDVRIERLIQNKFPGLRVDFSRGYDYLNDKDFFEIADVDVSKMSFMDRVNLHFKLGDRALVPFSEFEKIYVRLVDEAETYDQVVDAAKRITDFIGGQQDPQKQQVPDLTDAQSDKDAPETESKTQDVRQEQQDGDTDDDDDLDDGSDSLEGEPEAGMDQSETKTQRALDKNLQRMTKNDHINNVVYLRSQLTDFDDQVTSIKAYREDMETKIEEYRSVASTGLVKCREDFDRFMASIKRDVNYMVQQFEMRKSADAYARQQTHKTGVLDTERLHTYKLTDDIFLRQTVTPDGKNHGMMMLLDWSGSMQNIALATVKQIIVLAQFCRKVAIPFDVYTFTCQGYGMPFNDVDIEEKDLENRVAHSGPQLVNVLSSAVKRQFMDTDLFHLFMTANCISGYFYTLPRSSYLGMGGTPLNNTLFMLPELIRKMKSRTNAQKISCVVVTDGESTPLYYYCKGMRSYMHHNMVSPYQTILLRDGNHTYQIDSTDCTGSIVDYLNKKMPDVSISHIFLGGPRPCATYARFVTRTPLEKEVIDGNEFRKNGACVVKPRVGWPLVALINPNIFGDVQDEIECEQGATKSKIRQALRKMLKSKSSAKVVLSQLVESFS